MARWVKDMYFPDMSLLPAIPAFHLYGEVHAPGAASASAFLHVETIAERSAIRGWEIGAHRHDHACQLLLLSTGWVEYRIDAASGRIDAPCHILVQAGAVHGFRFADGTGGHVLTMAPGLFRRSGASDDALSVLLVAGSRGALDPETAAAAGWLATEIARHGMDGGSAYVVALAEALLCRLPAPVPEGSGSTGSDAARMQRFRALVDRDFRSDVAVGAYADALGITERTLTRLCRRATGLAPLRVIHLRRLTEAQRLLRYTNAAVGQIADELGFADPAYFSRFYRRMTGHSPLAERRYPSSASSA